MKCVSCGREYSVFDKRLFCECGSLLEVRWKKLPSISWELFRKRPFRLWRYRELIPLPRTAEIVTIGEGGTPLVRLDDKTFSELKLEVYAKLEGCNPTGSFKDRGMTVAVSIARFLGEKAVICASTGNTAASMSAYARAAGLRPIVVLPKGGVASGKVSQVILHGATLIEVKGSFDDAMSIIIRAFEGGLAYPLNSVNPWRLEGQKTVAYEVVDEVGVPDWIILPVGNAGNISAVWKGLKELRELGLIEKLPRLAGIQAEGAAPLANAFKKGLDRPIFVDEPETIASAIRIGKPVNWQKALKAVRESKGVLIDVSDREILESHKQLARKWGIGVEPASAASFAGLKKLIDTGEIARGEKIVVILTGHALKDPDVAIMHPINKISVDSIDSALEAIIGLTN